MTAPVEVRNSVESVEKARTTGLRSLPNLKLPYFARTPKKNPFATVWLPVNASNRCNKDKIQEKLHIYYSKQNRKEAGEHSSTIFSFDSDLPITDENRASYPEFQPAIKLPVERQNVAAAMWMTNKNSIAPFASLGKPTCGYFFSRATDNKKRLIGILPTNTVQWRTNELQHR